MNVKIRNKFIEIKYSVSNGLVKSIYQEEIAKFENESIQINLCFSHCKQYNRHQT